MERSKRKRLISQTGSVDHFTVEKRALSYWANPRIDIDTNPWGRKISTLQEGKSMFLSPEQ